MLVGLLSVMAGREKCRDRGRCVGLGPRRRWPWRLFLRRGRRDAVPKVWRRRPLGTSRPPLTSAGPAFGFINSPTVSWHQGQIVLEWHRPSGSRGRSMVDLFDPPSTPSPSSSSTSTHFPNTIVRLTPVGGWTSWWMGFFFTPAPTPPPLLEIRLRYVVVTRNHLWSVALPRSRSKRRAQGSRLKSDWSL